MTVWVEWVADTACSKNGVVISKVEVDTFAPGGQGLFFRPLSILITDMYLQNASRGFYL
jgi:hypothetical protein